MLTWCLAHPWMTFVLACLGLAAAEGMAKNVALAISGRRDVPQLPAPDDEVK